MSTLTDRCTIKIFYGGKSNGEDWTVAVKKVRSLVVLMIKQSVLKQLKGGGVGKGRSP